QANGAMHEILYQFVLEEVGGGDRALELHAGIGFFTLGLVGRFSHVDAVESSQSAVVDLRRNLKSSKGGRVRILAAPAEEVLQGEIAQAPDVVLMDPPRTGLSPRLLESIASLHPKRIVYLSCDPATLARDLARLADRGYRLRSIRGLDLFPQTPHVEVLASLTLD
ncbi:MAG: RsmD family RNA methyltransferase, partial [Myxococcota bacterium]